MMSESEYLEFEILGSKVRYRPEESDSSGANIDPKAVVELVNSELNDLMKKHGGIDRSELAILLALNMAAKRIALENEYKSNLSFLGKGTSEVLDLLRDFEIRT